MHLHPRQHHRPLAAAHPLQDRQARAAVEIGHLGHSRQREGRHRARHRAGEGITRQLQIARPRFPAHGLQHPHHLVHRRATRVEAGRLHAHLLEEALLGVAGADAVVEQGMLIRFPQARGTADHQQGGALRIGPRHRIEQLEGSHAVGHHRHPQAPEAGVGIGSEAGPLLPRHADHIDR